METADARCVAARSVPHASVSWILATLMSLPPEEQLEAFNRFGELLVSQGLLPR